MNEKIYTPGTKMRRGSVEYLFVASGFVWFNASRSVAVRVVCVCVFSSSRVLFNTFIKGREKERKEREGEREWKRESINLQEFGVITPTHVST